MAQDPVASTSRRSVRAYDKVERVRRYDRDMDLLHPNRHRMIGVALEILAEFEGRPSVALELGTGTGFFALRFLQRHREATLVGVDGAASMIELASARLRDAGVGDRARLVQSSFEDLDLSETKIGPVDIVFSSYALHHLHAEAKRAVLTRAISLLKPGGWFLNADLVSNPDPAVEAVIQRIRLDGIVARNLAQDEPDPRFVGADQVRDFIDALEQNEGDCPLPVGEDLALLRDSGINGAAVFWQEYREVVLGGQS
jgi:ubiquinone/menaquinone biosynthesis C-methylase UbiE